MRYTQIKWSLANIEYATSVLSSVGRERFADLLLLVEIVDRYLQQKGSRIFVTNEDIHRAIFDTEGRTDSEAGLIHDLRQGQ